MFLSYNTSSDAMDQMPLEQNSDDDEIDLFYDVGTWSDDEDTAGATSCIL